MLSSEHIANKLRELKPDLNRRFHVRKIGYFGSFADGTFDEQSDVDILVEFSETPGWEFFDLQILLEQIFQRKVDLVTPGALKDALKERILVQTHFV